MATSFKVTARGAWRRASVAIGVLAAVLAGGCSTMKVNVDVLDNTRVDPVSALSNAVDRAVARIESQDRKGWLDVQQSELRKRLASTLTALGGAGQVAKDDLQKFIATGNGSIDRGVGAARKARREAVSTYQQMLLTKEREKRVELLRATQERVKAGDTALDDLRSQLQELAEGVSAQGAAATSTAAVATRVRTVTAFQQDVNQIINSIIVGPGLFDDPYAAVVVGAPEEAWKARFSHSQAFDAFGNSDIAIRAEKGAFGNFTLKGVRLDARKVTQATFQALSQTIQLVAIAYGVPLPKPASTGSGGGDTSGTGASGSDPAQAASDAIAQAEASKRAAQTQGRSIRRAELSLIQAVVDEEANLKDATKVKAAAQNIADAFTVYKPQMTPAAAATAAAAASTSSGSSTSTNSN